MSARSEPRGLLSNTLASAAATLWVAGLTVVSVPILIRLLGAYEYGVWILVTVIAVQGRGIGSLLDCGLGQSLIQRVAAADDPRAVRGHLGAGVKALTIVGLIAAAMLGMLAPAIVDAFRISAFHAQAVVAVRLMALQLVVELPAVAMGAGLEGLRRYEVRRSIDAARASVFFAGAIVVVAGGGSIAPLALLSLGTAVLYAVALLAALVHFEALPSGGASMAAELRAGVPLLALRATGVGYRQLDRLVLGIVVGAVAVTSFDIADKVSLVALTALGAATSALIPATAHGLRTDPLRTRVLVMRATRWSALVSVPLAGFAFGTAGPLADLIAGRSIPGCAPAIRWLALATGLSVIFAAGFEMAIGAAAARRLVAVSLGGLALNLVATVILARSFGVAGAAAATFLASVAVTPVVARICGEVFDQPLRGLLNAAVPACVLGGLVATVSWVITSLVPDALGVVVAGVVSATVVGGWWRTTYRTESRRDMPHATRTAGVGA